MGLELQLEDVLLVNAVRLLWGADCVAQQRETGQWEVILEGQRGKLNTVASDYSPLTSAIQLQWVFLVNIRNQIRNVGRLPGASCRRTSRSW